jgi:hypothetical protein
MFTCGRTILCDRGDDPLMATKLPFEHRFPPTDLFDQAIVRRAELGAFLGSNDGKSA